MRNWIMILLCFFISIGVKAQTSITGTVVDETDEVLVGVSVAVKGTNVGTVTNNDGKFTIEVPVNNKTLVISFLGMKPVEVVASPNMRVILNTESEVLENVVVTGITTTDRRLFTGATDKLNASEIRLSGLPEIGRGLEGRSAGVSVQNVSGTFGTAPKIRVRGATSIYGSSKPLWVVDGVVLEDVIDVSADDLSSGDATTLITSAIAGLNADDIESFDILKDGSATSIYGARAMAGVIVITTKKGRPGISSFNYTGEFTSRLVPSYRNFNIMNSQEQMSVYQEMQQKGWLNLADLTNASSSGIYGKMYQLINTFDPATGQFGLPNTLEARTRYLREAEYRNTDWFDELFDSNIVQSHSVSMQSGTEKSYYYASVSALVDPGWSKASKINRYTANLNATYKILKNLEVNIITSGSYREQKAPGTLSQAIDPVFGEVKRDFDINPYSFALNTSRTLDTKEFYTENYAPFNILHELNNNYIDVNVADVKFQGEVKWRPIKGLELRALGSTRFQSTSQEHNITDFANQAVAYRTMPTATIRDKNPYLYTDPDNPYDVPITVLPQGGIYKRSDYSLRSYDFRAVVNYSETFKKTHIVNFDGGVELSSIDRHTTWFRGWGLQYSMGEIPFYAYQVFKKGVEEGSNYYEITNTSRRNLAFFANPTYSWKARYTLSGTVRYEGSNRLGKSRSARWLPTWNIAGAWNAHEEDFFKALTPTLSYLKLKASYSLNGMAGDATNSSIIIGSRSPWRPYAGIQESALYISSLENNALTYEKKHEINVGASIGFLNNRINVEADWYKRNNYDLIGPIVTQGVGGEILKRGNIAEMKSNGVEFTLSTENIKGKDFNWKTNFIYAHTNNQITRLQGSQRVIDLITGTGFAKEGYPQRSLFSVPFRGLNEYGVPTFLDQNRDVTTTGIYFQTRDTGNGELDFLDYAGSVEPTDFGSLGNIFTYKGWRLNVFITYSWGNVVRLDPVFKASYSDLDAMSKEYKNRWVQPGDEAYTNIPAIATLRQAQDSDLAYAYNAYNNSTARAAKGDFIRMKEISLMYEFPKKWITPLKINRLSLKGQATNLFLLYADKKLNGQDPEFFNTGGVAAPVPKQFTFTINLGF
ncbi:MAG: SusC/RagA family TonB-linked outer membrane protein [Prevotellaceae bacterium]|jgi:TonB-linked SusC/RagA family outer membrane protein|nr:SusC/RagA family TonB-linked outer membrane protein [Prevotellaceae bacterium]